MKKALTFILTLAMLAGLLMPTLAVSGATDLLGDGNCDGSVDSLDAAVVLRYDALMISDATEIQLAMCDVNGDGAVNSIDAARILKYDAGLIDSVDSETLALSVVDGKTNYALGASYRVTRINDGSTDPVILYLHDDSLNETVEKWGDANLTKITDGNTAAGESLSWVGSLSGTSVVHVGSHQIYEYVIDLGESYSDIGSVVFCGVRDGYVNGNNRGFDIGDCEIYVAYTESDWGARVVTTFSSKEIEGAPLIHEMMDDNKDAHIENFTYTFSFDTAATGRFVRILVSSPVYCLQFDEILVLSR